MDKDRIKGKMDDMAGRVKHQAGEWTGKRELEVKGAAQQVKGKAENVWGKAKDAVRQTADDAKKPGRERGAVIDEEQDVEGDVERDMERRKAS